MGKRVETMLAVLNGTIGDYLARTGNGLATPMELVVRGVPVPPRRAALRETLPDATGRVVVLVHGLMCTETVWTLPDGSDYGTRLGQDRGYTPLYVRYNSGLAIADSGAALSRLLDALVAEAPVPVEELMLLGFSMGGLVIRSACHEASFGESRWLPLVRRAIYVGTPHLGAPYERLGRFAARVLSAVDNPYTQLVADIANLRSAGVQDLGDADLRHEDRTDKTVVRLRDWRHPVPLLPQIQHYLVAGALSSEPWLAALFGDAVVPVASATAHATRSAPRGDGIPGEHLKIVPGVAHMGLAHHLGVYEIIRAWCGGSGGAG
jgi:triacylglycerol lipase